MTHEESIDKGIADKRSHGEIIRKVFLTYPTMALIGQEEKQFLILNHISEYFQIPINHVQVVGSAKTGTSFHKNTPFTPKESDLDIAIIDYNIFKFYSEFVFKQTKGYKNISSFKPGNFKKYIEYLTKGIFRPDLMPKSTIRAEWFKFFGLLSKDHNDLFETINAGVYMSQLYFEHKQISVIKDYLNNKAI